MITRITRMLLLAQVAIAAALCAAMAKIWHIDNLALSIASGFGLVVAARLLINANNFFISWIYRSETPAAFRLGRRAALRMFRDEFKASMTSSSWTMAFHAFKKRPASNPAGLPVLLIHGYGCNSGYWHSMSKALARARITHYAIDLEPVFAGIEEFVPQVHEAVEAVCRETGHAKIILVAHSMGGLVARAYLRERGSSRIAKVITLGTPHQGTALANFGTGSNSKQMCWRGKRGNGSACEWLRELDRAEDRATRALFVSLYSHHDNIVSPQTSSCLAGAVNIEFHGIGHVALASSPVIQQRVVAEILATDLQRPAQDNSVIAAAVSTAYR